MGAIAKDMQPSLTKEGPTEENVEHSVRAQEADIKKILLLLIFGQKNELNVIICN